MCIRDRTDVLVNSIAYFRMYFIGSIAVVMYNVGASILQYVGDSKSPMRYLLAASLINIVLDLIPVSYTHLEGKVQDAGENLSLCSWGPCASFIIHMFSCSRFSGLNTGSLRQQSSDKYT